MHIASLLRMKYFVENYTQDFKKAKILDVGSNDLNGSYKQFFTDNKFLYTGLDLEEGKNVDYVPKNPYKWTELKDNSFDIVISGQVLEHAEFFWFTVAEMARVLKEEGLLCIIVPRGFVRHRYPVDCYRFDTDGAIAIMRYIQCVPLHASTGLAPQGLGIDNDWYGDEQGDDTFFICKKPKNWKGILKPEDYVFEEADLEALKTGFISKEENIASYNETLTRIKECKNNLRKK